MDSHAMLGTKARVFAPLCNRSIEDLVPADKFYRHLEAKPTWASSATWSAQRIRNAVAHPSTRRSTSSSGW